MAKYNMPKGSSIRSLGMLPPGGSSCSGHQKVPIWPEAQLKKKNQSVPWSPKVGMQLGLRKTRVYWDQWQPWEYCLRAA